MVQWAIAARDSLLWHAWPEAYSLYDRQSGQTHLLNELPAELVRTLTLAPRTTPELVEHIAGILQAPATDPLRNTVEHALQQLEGLRLIRQTP